MWAVGTGRVPCERSVTGWQTPSEVLGGEGPPSLHEMDPQEKEGEQSSAMGYFSQAFSISETIHEEKNLTQHRLADA